MKKWSISILCVAVVFCWSCAEAMALQLVKAGTYNSGVFDASAAEIVGYDAQSKKAFVVNAHADKVDVLDLADITAPKLAASASLKEFGKGVNSVAVKNGLVAIAVEADPKQEPGKIVVMDTSGDVQGVFPAGALPDMVCFTPDGNYILSANEGEPNKQYDNDPEGSVTVVDISQGLDKAKVTQVDFTSLNDRKQALAAKGIRISHPGSTVAQDLEPEYMAISGDSRTAYVTLQENNAVAVIDIPSARLAGIWSLGLKDWAALGLELDASDKDDAVNLQSWPVLGCYMPDSIASYEVGGKTYLVVANEGDSREYGEDEDNPVYVDEIRVGKAKLDPEKFPNAAELQKKKNLGRLKVVKDLSDPDGDGDLDRLVAFGGRSFSIYTSDGKQVFDSGDVFEKKLAELYPGNFNASNDKNKKDNRSDDKGPEPEGVTVGAIGSKTYAFVGLERMGGIMVYDITDPQNPSFVLYQLDRDFSADPESGKAGDLGPEGLCFVPASSSPSGKDLLLVGNEVSGTTAIYEIIQ